MGMTYILYNRLANNGKGDEGVESIIEKTGKDAVTVDVSATDVRALAESLEDDDTMILCGGDGTVNRFANDIYGIKPRFPIYLWSSGTGNDFLNDIGVPEGEKAVLINEYIEELPTVTVNGETRRFINNVGFGIDGAVCERADEMKAKGKIKINYTAIAAKLLMFKYDPPKATVTVDGRTRTYNRVWMAPAMNGRYYGGGMMVAPMQDRKSGMLSSVVVHRVSRLVALTRFPGIFKGKHIRYKEMVDWIKGDEITVKFDRPTALQIDGDTIVGVLEFSARSARSSQGEECGVGGKTFAGQI